VEEERRLFYVAVTRPRRRLEVYVPQRYHHRPRRREDPHSWAQPSRFLTDGVRSHLDEVQRGHPHEWPAGLGPDGAGSAGAGAVPAAAVVGAQLEALWG
jgi:ATP-dependent exoDNAse (exonuclease V) beta subunit